MLAIIAVVVFAIAFIIRVTATAQHQGLKALGL